MIGYVRHLKILCSDTVSLFMMDDQKRGKVLVSLPEGIFKLIRELKGKIGESDSEIVRNIVIAYLSEKGYLSKRES